MTAVYLDTDVLYVHLRQPATGGDPRAARWLQRVRETIDSDPPVISGLVVDELAYRSILAWLREAGKSDPLSAYRASPADVTRSLAHRLQMLWDAIDLLQPAIATCDRQVVTMARELMTEPGLAPRDAFHAAHAISAGCDLIASGDSGFDRVAELGRLGP